MIPIRLAILTALMTLVCALPAQAEGEGAPTAEEMKKLTQDAAEDLAAVRKVTLKQIPPVEVVSRERYVEEYVLPVFDWMWSGKFDESLAILKALGMVSQDLETKPFLRKYGAATTVAAYDFLRKRILFPGETSTPDTLVHELMHASQDERHDLKAFMAPARGNFDETLARGALIEGEALNVQLRYQLGYPRALAGVTPYGTLRDEARAYFEQMNARMQRSLPEAPSAVLGAQAFVYEEGVLFVERLRRREHNWAAVDAAYANPPRSTTQILHPEKYLAGEWPVALDVERVEKFLPNHQRIAENTLGEFGMRLFLAARGSDAENAAKAVEGWRGDRVLLYRDDVKKADAVVWVSTWENPERAAAAAKALEGAFRGARVSARGVDVTLIAGAALPAMPDFKIVRKPSTEGRPLGEQDERK